MTTDGGKAEPMYHNPKTAEVQSGSTGSIRDAIASRTDLGMLLLAAAFQMLTIPVAAHMVGEVVYRTKQVNSSHLALDGLRKTPNVAGTSPRARITEEKRRAPVWLSSLTVRTPERSADPRYGG